MSTYHVHFRARATTPLPGDAVERLSRALRDLPSAREVGTAGREGETLAGAFAIGVPKGRMSEATRDGGRLAKESLNSAGIDAQLVELLVRLDQE